MALGEKYEEGEKKRNERRSGRVFAALLTPHARRAKTQNYLVSLLVFMRKKVLRSVETRNGSLAKRSPAREERETLK